MLKHIKPFLPRRIRLFSKTILKSKVSKALLAEASKNNLKTLAMLYATDKWGVHWYMEHYETHFKPFQRKAIKLLEIGIGGYDDPKGGGGSLKVWKQYFTQGQIFGLDLYDKKPLEEDRIKTFKGSQADTEFLQSVVKQTGELDIVIDDGSHRVDHVIASFKILFPHLKKGGIYVIEDLQTSYHQAWGGDRNNLNNQETSMNFLKRLTDGINHMEYLKDGDDPSYIDRHIVSIHFYHNLVFIYKGDNNELPSNQH